MDKALWKKLRIPQKEAFKKMEEYINGYRENKTSKAALVQMPTGSGKTGVAACLAHFLIGINNVLIISPRVALRKQLYRDISGDFFIERNYKTALPKIVVEAESSTDFPEPSNNIIVTTIQKLHHLAVNDEKIFRELYSKIDLIIFDEGHYEPSPVWSTTIRIFTCPKIIFTATPFRNDFKTFDIDNNHIYSYSFGASVRTGILRKVIVMKKKYITSPKEFVEDVLNEYRILISKEINDDSRIIIRCDDASSIRQIAKVLVQKQEKFIAIHETFDEVNGAEWEYKSVPNPEDLDAKIWIHQYKLLEGIDEPRFRLLATYERFSNARQLIQQIGRIIRNPNKIIGEKAYFLDHSNGIQEKMWNEYLEYDLQISKNPSQSIADIFEKILGQLPEKEYLNGRFRKRFDLSETLDPLINEIRLPLRSNFIELTDEFREEDLCFFLERRFEEEDFKYKKYYINEFGAFVYLYVQLSHSQILSERYFINLSLNICLFKKIADKFLSFYDSLNFVPLNNDQLNIGKALEPRQLKKLISENENSRLTNIALKNSNLGNRSIRSHSYTAASINEVTPFLDDHAQVISNITGYSFEGKYPESEKDIIRRRYIGLNKGRVSEGSTYYKLSDYFNWLNNTSKLLSNTSRKSLSTFKRYSKEKENVTNTNPLHILLDFSEIDHLRFRDVTDNEYEAIFEDLSSEIAVSNSEAKFSFTIHESSQDLDFEIQYDTKRKKYILSSDKVSGSYFTNEKVELIKYLNETQSFRVIPEERNCIYIDGNFYEPTIKIGSQFNVENFHVGHILHADSFLLKYGDEKGEKCKSDGSGWEDNSLFDFIHKCGKDSSLEDLFGKPDVLICDDLGTECADFILSDNDRVIFIHAKGLGKNKSDYSASKLQEVCGQATKNIQYLSMFNDLTPKKLEKWDRAWNVKDIGKVTSRKLIGSGRPKEIWEKIKSRINNPLKSKEVWIVLGRTLSKSILINHLAKTKPSHEAVQSAILLHGTMTNVNSIGAKLRVFCHP